MRAFIECYNNIHYHTGLALLRPVDVHSARVDECVASRNATLAIAYDKHPERFVKRKPIAATIESIVYINRPEDSEAA